MNLLQLPSEVLSLVLSHLDARSYDLVSSTCKTLRGVCDAKEFWQARLCADFCVPASDEAAALQAAAAAVGVELDTNAAKSWRALYRQLFRLRAGFRRAVTVVPGSIQEQATEVIVVPTSTDMRPMYGSSMWSVIRRGGPLLDQERRRLAPLPPFGCCVARGGALAAPHVIFTAGPFWSGGAAGELGELSVTYDNCLAEVRRLSPRSVSFAAISTGMRGYPLDLACRIAISRILLFIRDQMAMGEPIPEEFRMVCNPRTLREDGTNEVTALYGEALSRLDEHFGLHAMSGDPLHPGPSPLRTFVDERWLAPEAGPAPPPAEQGQPAAAAGGSGDDDDGVDDEEAF